MSRKNSTLDLFGAMESIYVKAQILGYLCFKIQIQLNNFFYSTFYNFFV